MNSRFKIVTLFFIKIIVILFILYNIFCDEPVCESNKKNIAQNDQSTEYNHIVDSTFRNSQKRGVPTIKFTDGSIYMVWNYDIFNVAKKGDRIFKNANSHKFYLIKQTDTIMYYHMSCGEAISDEYAAEYGF